MDTLIQRIVAVNLNLQELLIAYKIQIVTTINHKNYKFLKDCEKIDYSLLYENLFKEFNDLKIKYDKLVEDNGTINIITKYHVHPLAKCRLERETYTCNKCLKEYNGFIPSYYCSLCDYDLCESCGRKIKNLSVDY